MKKVVQDLTSGGIDWQREKWQSGLGSKFIHQGEKNTVKYADEVIVLSKGVEWKETEKKDYVLYFGRFSEEKGIGTLIKVCKELPDVQFIFAGTGPLEETVNGIKNIKNVGFQKGEALEKLICEARFSIYPSEWYENCPFSVMESQMYGTPVLGANIGGIPELIQVGKTGELFESGNAEDLKKKIEKLWGDKKLCAEYSANCKDISFDTIDEYYEKIMKVYQ